MFDLVKFLLQAPLPHPNLSLIPLIGLHCCHSQNFLFASLTIAAECCFQALLTLLSFSPSIMLHQISSCSNEKIMKKNVHSTKFA